MSDEMIVISGPSINCGFPMTTYIPTCSTGPSKPEKIPSVKVAAANYRKAKLGKVDGSVLMEVAKRVDVRHGYFSLAQEYAPDAAAALGVKLPPRPTIEQFKPKAEAEKKATVKPTPKKKAA